MSAQKFELAISCRDLPNADSGSKSDPQARIFLSDPYNGTDWQEIGRTEMVWDSLNPDFFTKIPIVRRSGEQNTGRILRIDVFDLEPHRPRMQINGRFASEFYLGSATIPLDQLLSRPDMPISLPLMNNSYGSGFNIMTNPFAILTLESPLDTYQLVHMKWGAHRLKNKSLFFNLDPFLVISRAIGATIEEDFQAVFRTEPKSGTNPSWPPVRLPTDVLCRNDWNRLLKLEVMDLSSTGTHPCVGTAYTTLTKLIEQNSAAPPAMLELHHPKKGPFSNKNYGYLFLEEFNIYDPR